MNTNTIAIPTDAPTVHIFFNGHDCYCPPGAVWEKFVGLDSMRIFLVCAESWRRNGWKVKRLTTADDGSYRKINYDLVKGECRKSFDWYPLPFWQFIPKAKAIAAKAKNRLHYFATIDCINFAYTGDCVREVKVSDCVCVNLQKEHASLGAFAADFEWLDYAEEILRQYDCGRLAPLNREYTSDETILREYARHGRVNTDAMTFACNTEKDKFPLVHFSRSACKPALDTYSFS